MNAALSTAVCSITPTQRGRFFWAAWWTAAPQFTPFRKPDASNGGAESEAQALAEAERLSGRHLTRIEPYWARAWKQVLRGGTPVPPRASPPRNTATQAAGQTSAWSVLGLAPGADRSEVKQAFRKRALETHPDHGGDPAAFRELQAAYLKLMARFKKGERPRSASRR